jgi:hypothetical protein
LKHSNHQGKGFNRWAGFGCTVISESFGDNRAILGTRQVC